MMDRSSLTPEPWDDAVREARAVAERDNQRSSRQRGATLGTNVSSRQDFDARRLSADARSAKMIDVPMSPYVARLRALVGNELLHLPSVAALCRDNSGRILLVKQSDSGNWSTRGGAMNRGDPPKKAVIREVHEETGLDISVDGLRTAVGGPEYRTIYAN